MYAVGKKYAKVKGTIGDYLNESIEVGLVYYHYDNLGSTRVMTNQDGEKVFDQDYLPFGGDLPKPGQLEVFNKTDESYKYTGQKKVASIGLYYYGARYYDPVVGRFTRQDSYRGELTNPQSQHLYVYVMNNPLKYVDPTGHSAVLDMWHEDIKKYERLASRLPDWAVKEIGINSEEQIINKFLMTNKSFIKEHTVDGKLYRYKLVPETRVRRLKQTLVGMLPGGLTRSFERGLGLVGGNSLMSEDEALNKTALDLALKGAEQFVEEASIVGGITAFVGISKDVYNMFGEKGLYHQDEIAFDLMDEAGISVYGNDSDRLENRIGTVYDYIGKNETYFLEEYSKLGLFRTGMRISQEYYSREISNYEYDTEVVEHYLYNDSISLNKFQQYQAKKKEWRREGYIEKLKQEYQEENKE